MNTIPKIAVILAILTGAAIGQGTLTPPGTPAPTMKSLLEIWNKIVTLDTQGDEIYAAVTAVRSDPRTPIVTAPTTISQPGSYVLGANLSVATGDAITISSDNVTLDLGGFTIASTHPSGSGSGIVISDTFHNICIKNGNINSATTVLGSTFTTHGFDNGILSTSLFSRNISILDVHVHGVAVKGISIGSDSSNNLLIQRCTANICSNSGLTAGIVRDCSASDIGRAGITASIVSDSSAVCVGTGGLDHAITANSVTNSRGVANAGYGINAATVSNSTGVSTANSAIFGTEVTNSTGTSTNSTGIASQGNVTNSSGTSTSGPFGIIANGTASFCRGRRDGGTAISAGIAVACTVSGTGTVSSPQKHLGTP